jgi:carboxylesterase type B
MMSRTPFTRCALLLSISALAIGAATALVQGRQGGGLNQPVKVQGGLVAGVPGKRAGFTAFRGVPFAAAPVGSRRWQAPQPAEPWTGVKKAEAFGPSCIQTVVQERKPWTYEFMTHGEVSEDCLFVNIYWANFATTGDPNGKGLPAWPAVDGKSWMTMELNEKPRAIPAADTPAKQAFVERALARR